MRAGESEEKKGVSVKVQLKIRESILASLSINGLIDVINSLQKLILRAARGPKAGSTGMTSE